MPNLAKIEEEKQLILESIAGNKQSFGRLYDSYYAQIYRYLFYRLAQEEDAMDLSAAVFLRAWQRLPSFGRQGRFQFRAWLFRIAHNALVDHYRTSKPVTSLQELGDIPADNVDTAQQVEQRQQARALAEAMQTLDQRSQAVLACRFIAGLSHAETAQVLDLTAGNVRIIQLRALRRMKELLVEVNHEG